MAKIERLTAEEETLIPTVRDEWLKTGLATGPADRVAAQAAISDAYRIAGMEPPKLWIWLGSPWAGCFGAWMLTKLPPAGDQVGDQVRDQVWAQVRDQVRDQVGDQVGDQVRDQVWAQVRDQVRDQVGDQVWAQVWAQVRDQVGDQVRDQVGDQVWAQVWAQVRDQVRDQVWAQVWAQVRDQVWAQVWAQVRDQVRDQVWDQVGDQRWKAGYGLQDANWLAFYDLFRRIKRVKGPERLEPLMRLAAVAGWWWPFQGACIVTERPTALHRDEAFRLHSDSGPALAYPDGWSIHAWHGLRIPAWLIEDRARITPDAIDTEGNTELRRVMLEIFGFDRYIEARGAKLIAEDECLGLPRHLFDINLAGERVRVLRVVNGTIEPDGRQRQFHLGVPLEVDTPHAAVAWSYGRPAERHQEAVRS